MRHGLLGGSFDPFHDGHRWLVTAAIDDVGCERVWVVPAARPPHKPGGVLTPVADRLAMCRAALADTDAVTVDDCETRRDGPSFTVDTLAELVARAPPGDEWVLLLGADMAVDFSGWREPARIRAMARLAVAARPGVPLPGDLGDVIELGGTPPDVSSTEVRQRVAAGRPITDLVPPAVAAYIAENGLYRTRSA